MQEIIPETKREKNLNKELYLLNQDEKKSYISALEHLGIKKSSKYNKKNICIDKTGFSPEVAKNLGEFYLKNRFIIISPQQKNTPVINPALSCTEMVADYFFEKSKTLLENVLNYEPIVGNINVELKYAAKKTKEEEEKQKGHPIGRIDLFKYFKDTYGIKGIKDTKSGLETSLLENSMDIHGEINTPSQLIGRLRKNIQSEKGLIKDLNSLLKPGYLKKLQKEIRELKKIVGDTRNYSIENINVTIEPEKIGILKAHMIDDNKQMHEIFFVNGIKPKMFFFSHDNNSGSYGQKNNANIKTRTCSEDPDKILKAMLENNHIAFDTELTYKKIIDIENNVLAKHGFTFIRKGNDVKLGKRLARREVSNIERLSLLNQHPSWIKEFDHEWDLLENILSNPNTNLDSIPHNIKFQFTKVIENKPSQELACEILAKINPLDYVASQKYDEQGFIQKFQESNGDTKRMIIAKLLGLKENEKNQKINAWLNKNHPRLTAEVKEVLK